MVKVRKRFPDEQETWIILEYGAVKSYRVDRRNFRQKFGVHPKNVPKDTTFKRLIDRLVVNKGYAKISVVTTGRPPYPDNTVKAVKDFLDPFLSRKETVSLRRVAS